jgi:ABC-type uncharacterized transport system involved in gliding motility auxiliary subunit
MNRNVYAAILIALSVIIFFALNIFANVAFRQARLDLTESGLFTISDGAIKTLQSIEEPVTLRYFFSEAVATEYPRERAYGARVQDLLQEFAASSGGKLIVEVIEPEQFSEEEELAVALGVTAVGTQSGDSLFLGVVGTNLANGREVIPFLNRDREEFLEYDLTEMIYRLSTFTRPTVGLITSLPLATGAGAGAMGGRPSPFLIYSALEEKFDIRFLSEDFSAIDSDISVLLLAHPGPLTPTALYAIDQYVLNGGRVLAFLDPNSELGTRPGPMGQPDPNSIASSDMEPLLKAWGVNIPDDTVVTDRKRAERVVVPIAGQRRAVDYVVWVSLTEDDINADDIVTADLSKISMGSAGRIVALEGAATKMTPLVTTSDQAMLVAAEEIRYAPNPDLLLQNFQASGERYAIAARISGPVKTAYPNGQPAEPAPEGDADKDVEVDTDEAETLESVPQILASTEDINVIIVADADLFDDQFWVRTQDFFGQTIASPIADNSAFVLNAIENLMGSNELIGLRSRSKSDRPFKVVEQLRRDAQARYMAEDEALTQRISQTEGRLAALERQTPQGEDGAPINAAALSPEQRAEIDQLKNDLRKSHRAQRQVQNNLRRDIEALGGRLAFINIGLVPFLILIFALVSLVLKQRRRAAKQ